MPGVGDTDVWDKTDRVPSQGADRLVEEQIIKHLTTV